MTHGHHDPQQTHRPLWPPSRDCFHCHAMMQRNEAAPEAGPEAAPEAASEGTREKGPCGSTVDPSIATSPEEAE